MKTDASRRANKRWRRANRGVKQCYDSTWRAARRVKLLALLGGKCVRCGYQEHSSALDFDHMDEEAKEFTISNHLNRSWERLVAEVTKCRVLCANCHRIRTHAPELF